MPPNQPLSEQGYRIGEAARRSGLSAANIRFYESKLLLKAPPRSASSYRLYSPQDIHQLRFIRLCRAMDMSLDEVKTLLGLDLRRKADCATARDALDGHLHHVRERLAELQVLERDLLALRNSCDGQGERCRLIETLHRQADTLVDQGAAPAPAHKATRHV